MNPCTLTVKVLDLFMSVRAETKAINVADATMLSRGSRSLSTKSISRSLSGRGIADFDRENLGLAETRKQSGVTEDRRPNFIDLFCGIGIGSLGFLRAGFQIAAAVDIDEEACKIYEKNLKVKPIVGDLTKLSGQEILVQAGLKKGEVDLCVGCPPCQGFSSLRRTRLKKGQRDNRKSLLKVFGDRIEELSPKVLVLENVRGLAFRKNKKFLNAFESRMTKLGYDCKRGVLDAADYGVPQHRDRLILIGVKDGTSPELPFPTHGNPKLNEAKKPWRTVRDSIYGLPYLRVGQKNRDDDLHGASDHSEKVLDIIRNIPKNGGGRKSLPRSLWLPCHEKLDGEKGAESVYGRMRWDSPSPTITTRCYVPACGRYLHPRQNRGISLREAARLQTIPDGFKIVGYKDRVATWIGNAMPTALSESIGKQVIQYVS